MADPTPNHESNGDTGTPRWVIVFGIIILVLILLVALMMFIGGDHGPGRHLPSGDTVYRTSPSSVTSLHVLPQGGR